MRHWIYYSLLVFSIAWTVLPAFGQNAARADELFAAAQENAQALQELPENAGNGLVIPLCASRVIVRVYARDL